MFQEDENVISPLQGFKVAITNLAHSVTHDDIIVSNYTDRYYHVSSKKSVNGIVNEVHSAMYRKRGYHFAC